MRKKLLLATFGAVSLVGVTLAATGPGPATAQAPNASIPIDDSKHPSATVQRGTLPVVEADGSPAPQARVGAAEAAALPDPTVGDTRNWLGLDDMFGFYYRKTFTLLALRDNVEIWVASELNRRAPSNPAIPAAGQSSGVAFLDGDCRNNRAIVTSAQANYLADEFQNNMLPKESAAFSVAPDRDGTNALLGPPFAPLGPGQRTVVLVDNVRDDNFYDLNNTRGLSFIAGFFSSQLNTFFDRNIMTIDGFDWLHRTGANPPNDPVPGNNCTSAPARPFGYESVFAHEYQHLLESYEDGDEVNWINEGLSDWAQTLTGYTQPARPIDQVGFDSHVQCFLGWLGVQTAANPNPRLTSGPENSLTRWEDQGPGEILCDYGAAYTFMEMVAGRYGTPFMSALHRGDANGFAGVQEALDAVGITKTKAIDVFHDWTLMVALDGLIDDGARISGSVKESDVSAPTLHATINWDTPEAYSTPGAPSNGSDYVRLRGPGGYLSGDDIDSLAFQGATTLPPKPVAWTVDAATGSLYSGAANNRDEAIVRQVAVPAGAGAVLNFQGRWNEEIGWDFGFVQISTDGGATYTSVACSDTTTLTDPGALPTAKDNVPGFTGDSGGFRPQTCSLSAYAGQTVLLAFRAFNDPAVLGENPAIPPGFWVDDVRVGTTVVSDGTTLAGWRSFTEVRPPTVDNFVVHIISIEHRDRGGRDDDDDDDDDDRGRGRGGDRVRIKVRRLPLTSDFVIKGRANARKFVDRNADLVAAVVTYDEPTETVNQYAPYRLTVNGVVQPGGGM